jgi:hypothetical protein
MLCRLSYASNLDREIFQYTSSAHRRKAFPHDDEKAL